MNKLLDLVLEDSSADDNITELNKSGSDDEQSEPSENVKPKLRGRNRSYDFLKSFEGLHGLNDAQAAVVNGEIDEEGHWTKGNVTRTAEGTKFFYNCYPECNKRIYILVRNDSLDNDIYISTDEHDHNEEEHEGILPTKTKQFILDLYLNKKTRKPFRILELIMENNLPQVTKTQLNNFIQRIKVKHFGSSNCTLSDFITWCEDNKAVPDDEDTTFCLNYEYLVHPNSLEVEYYRAFLTTKRLLSFMEFNKILASDGTHKITYQGYPAIVLGTLDKMKRFHPFGLCLVFGETADDYEFAFKSLIKKKADYKPNILIADNAPAITNAFVSTFSPENLIRVYCWAHVYKRVQLKRSLIKDKKLRDIITKKELLMLQECSSNLIFEKASELWLKKFKNNEMVNDFIEYFQKNWVENNSNWYEGYHNDVPSTNNALESTNRYIKDHGLERNRLGILQFLNIMEKEYITQWSLKRNKEKNLNAIDYATEPILKLCDWTAAYQWILKRKNVIKWNNLHFSRRETSGLTLNEVKSYVRLVKDLSFKDYNEM